MHCDQFKCSSVAWLFYNQLYSKIFPIFYHILDLQQIRMLLLQSDLFQNISYFAGGIATNLCTIQHQQYHQGHVFVSKSTGFWKYKFCAKKYSLSKISNFISKCHMLVLQLARFYRENKIVQISSAQYFKLSVLYWTQIHKPNCGQSNLVCPIY